MSYLIIPKGYKSALTPEETERGIKLVKDFFQQSLSKALKLRRVTAPLFVLQGQGINDDLSGVERAVSFPVKDLDDARAEVVQTRAWGTFTRSTSTSGTGKGPSRHQTAT